MLGVRDEVRVLSVAPGSVQKAALLRRFQRVEPLLFDRDLEGAAIYRLVRGGAVLGLAAVEPGLDLQAALDVPSCGYSVDLLGAVVVLPGWRRRGLGRLFAQRLLELHPRLVCVAAVGTEGFWRALVPSMVVHPLDGEGCRFVSAEVAGHIGACRTNAMGTV